MTGGPAVVVVATVVAVVALAAVLETLRFVWLLLAVALVGVKVVADAVVATVGTLPGGSLNLDRRIGRDDMLFKS